MCKDCCDLDLVQNENLSSNFTAQGQAHLKTAKANAHPKFLNKLALF